MRRKFCLCRERSVFSTHCWPLRSREAATCWDTWAQRELMLRSTVSTSRTALGQNRVGTRRLQMYGSGRGHLRSEHGSVGTAPGLGPAGTAIADLPGHHAACCTESRGSQLTSALTHTGVPTTQAHLGLSSQTSQAESTKAQLPTPACMPTSDECGRKLTSQQEGYLSPPKHSGAQARGGTAQT